MTLLTHTKSLDRDARQTRAVGRAGRDRMANARVTDAERHELHEAARAKGMSLSEWSREVLLREARRSDDALFTELVATRMLMVNLLKPLILGKQVSQDWITEAMAAVRREKRKAARDLMQLYTEETAGGQ